MATAAGDRFAQGGGGSVGSASGGIPPETREYFNKVVEPATKIALYSIGQFAMHLVAYGLLIGALGTGIAAAGGAFGNIDTVYRVLAGGGALAICGAGGFVTKFILPDLSDNLNLKIEEEKEKLDEALSKKESPKPESDSANLDQKIEKEKLDTLPQKESSEFESDSDSVQFTTENGIEGGYQDERVPASTTHFE